jgi:hypothetical protein
MVNLTAKILTLGLLTLVPLSLEGQKNKNENYCSPRNSKIDGGNNYSNRENYDYSLSKECKDYNQNVYNKATRGKPVFLLRDARHYSRKVNANRMHDNYKGIARLEKKYSNHIHKKVRIKDF